MMSANRAMPHLRIENALTRRAEETPESGHLSTSSLGWLNAVQKILPSTPTLNRVRWGNPRVSGVTHHTPTRLTKEVKRAVAKATKQHKSNASLRRHQAFMEKIQEAEGRSRPGGQDGGCGREGSGHESSGSSGGRGHGQEDATGLREDSRGQGREGLHGRCERLRWPGESRGGEALGSRVRSGAKPTRTAWRASGACSSAPTRALSTS